MDANISANYLLNTSDCGNYGKIHCDYSLIKAIIQFGLAAFATLSNVKAAWMVGYALKINGSIKIFFSC